MLRGYTACAHRVKTFMTTYAAVDDSPRCLHELQIVNDHKTGTLLSDL